MWGPDAQHNKLASAEPSTDKVSARASIAEARALTPVSVHAAEPHARLRESFGVNEEAEVAGRLHAEHELHVD
jgi:hypothetical protein